MKTIGTIGAGSYDEFVRVLSLMEFRPTICLEDGVIKQALSDRASLTLDLSSVIGKLSMSIMVIPDEFKGLKRLSADGTDVYVDEHEGNYILRGTDFNAPLAKYPKKLYLNSTPLIAGSGQLLPLDRQAISLSKDITKFTKIVYKHGPVKFIMNKGRKVTSIANSTGAEYKFNTMKLIPGGTISKDSTALELHSFWLHELKPLGIEFSIMLEQAEDLATNGELFWLDAKINVGSGLTVTLIERLQPKLWK